MLLIFIGVFIHHLQGDPLPEADHRKSSSSKIVISQSLIEGILTPRWLKCQFPQAQIIKRIMQYNLFMLGPITGPSTG